MRRRSLGACAWLALVGGSTPLLLGLGSMGGRDIANPPVDFRATLTDRDGVTIEVNAVNIGGDVQLEGQMGRGILRIPFDNIQSIDFDAESRDYGRAVVHLKSGDSVTVRVRNSLTIYGRTKLGVYQVRARDLQRIQFSS